METTNKRIDDVHGTVLLIQETLMDLSKTLASNTAILQRNTEDLSEHMRRTEILELRIEKTEQPIKFIKSMLVLVGALGTIFTTYSLLINIFKSGK